MLKGFLSHHGITAFQKLLIGSFIQKFLFSIHMDRLELQTEALKGFLRVANQLSRLCKQFFLFLAESVWYGTKHLFHRITEVSAFLGFQPLLDLFPVLNQHQGQRG